MLLLLSLMTRHNLNMSCIADVIEATQLHCPDVDLKSNSLYKFKKFFNIEISNKITKHYYCSRCYRDLEPGNNACPSCPQEKNSYFIQLPIVKQMREMYKRQNFYNKSQERFGRHDLADNTISDVYDGVLYKQYVHNGFLRSPHNVSFTWYTDGIPVFKSSKISVTPVLLTFNELPCADRKKRENTVLMGLWYGDKKPNMNFFFYKLRSDIEKLYQGIEITLPNQERIIVRGIILMGVADLPAKIDCLNFVQFNGKYGCPVCFCSRESIRIGPSTCIQCYPYIQEFEERTTERCIEYADLARPGVPVFGVKGITSLSRLMPDFVKGMAIDRMHALDGGVLKKILTLCLHSKYSRSPFSLSRHTDIINIRLKSIKPSKFVHRMPRDVNDLIHWKASELKMFLFFYSIPVLEGIMTPEYFNHFLTLIVAAVILSADKISDLAIDVAEDLLNRYVKDFQDLYGLRFCSINVHLLLHLPNCVRNLGPLWAYSCYEYEDMNGQFLKSIHGTWHLETQIAAAHTRQIAMVRFIEELPAGPILNCCIKKKHQVKIIEEVSADTFSVGAYHHLQEPADVIKDALTNKGLTVDDFRVWQYFRLLKKKKLYVSELYLRALQTSSSAIQYREDDGINFGIVLCFIKLRVKNRRGVDARDSHYAIVRKIMCDNVFEAEGNNHRYSTTGFMYECHEIHEFEAIPLDSIMYPCIYMYMDGQAYLAVPINSKELE